MNTPVLPRIVSPRPYLVVAWGIFAAIAGLGCVVLPSYLASASNAQPAYGHPLIPWFAVAFNNPHPMHTMLSFFLLGAVLGITRPRRWLLLSCLAVSLAPILNAINIVYDGILDSTSHNLWPFEFASLAFVSVPAILGAFVGSRIGRLIHAEAA